MRLENPAQAVFSVVSPTFRRPESLARLLAAIDAQNFEHSRMEVIVVDDSGEDALEAVFAPYRRRFRLTTLGTPHLGPAAARQAGAAVATGQYLVFTDDDCAPDREWLREMLNALEANPGCAVGGGVVNALRENVYSEASQILFDYLVDRHARDEVEFVGTGNVAFPAEAFREIGGLDCTWKIWGGEDRDLCRRWRQWGHKFILHPAALVVHSHPLTLSTFWDQHYRYGRGASRFARDSSLQKPGFYLGLVAAGFRRGRVKTGSVVLLSQAATAWGFLAERLFGAIADRRHP